jgi:hypothetical protein
MTVLLTMDIPVGREDLEAVSAELGVRENRPDGLIMHTMIETPGGVRVVDVWESEPQWVRFREERLNPAIGKVMADRGVSLDGPPAEPTLNEAYDLV